MKYSAFVLVQAELQGVCFCSAILFMSFIVYSLSRV